MLAPLRMEMVLQLRFASVISDTELSLIYAD